MPLLLLLTNKPHKSYASAAPFLVWPIRPQKRQ
jgi:hypothetical protein